MKKLLFIFLGLFIGSASAGLKEDITAQGNLSYLHKNVSAQKWSTTIRDWEIVTAANTILYTECGKTFFLNSATEFASTLPAVADSEGCTFRFIVKAAPSGASYTILTGNSLENVLIGHVETADVNTAAADGDSSTADDTITIADGVAVVGDQVELYSDGVKWFYIAHSKVYNGITAAQAD